MTSFSSKNIVPPLRVEYFTVPRRDMAYLKFIMEAYEGLATLSTADKLNGIVRISWDSARSPAVEQLLRALQQEIALVKTTEPHDQTATATIR